MNEGHTYLARAPLLSRVLLATFLAAGLYFASLQNVWIDETTQLSGVTLEFPRLFAWLAGEPVPAFGVPGDRTPPFSYLIDRLCLLSICRDPLDLRLLHLLITFAGIAIIVWMMKRHYGAVAALMAAAFLVLSPKLTEIAVEIRAYPILFTITCAQLVLLHSIHGRDLGGRKILPFALLGVISIYTHFYGLISTSALFAGLVAGAAGRKSATRLIVAYLCVLAAAAGLLPFIAGSAKISGPSEGSPTDPITILTYLLRLVSHSSTMLSPMAALMFFAGLGSIGLIAIWRLVETSDGSWRLFLRQPVTGVLVALVAGVAVTLAAALVVQGFNPLRPSYSVWMFPLFGVIVGAAFSPKLAPVRWRALAVASAAFLAGALWSHALFLRHAGLFVHGPERAIVAEFKKDPQRTAIAYNGPHWAYGFFPIHYQYRDRAPQWLLDASGTRVRRILPGGHLSEQIVRVDTLPYRRIILADINARTFRDLRDYLEGVRRASPLARQGAPATAWQAGHVTESPGLYWLSMRAMTRRTAQ